MATDYYLITINGSITDLAGNSVLNNKGNPGRFSTTFELRPKPVVAGPPKVVSVTTQHGSVPINGKPIAQPDTIAIAFNKPLNFLTVTPQTVKLLAGSHNLPVAESVIYSPTTNTIYLTPQAALLPGFTYTVRVNGKGAPGTPVTGDQGFPKPGLPMASSFTTTFQVSSPPVNSTHGPLRVLKDGKGKLAISPGPGVRSGPFGYASIPFSEPLDMSSLGRFSVILSLQAGGLKNSAFDVADAPLNARLAFNPNTNTLILVPTVRLAGGSYRFTLSNMKAKNGDPLKNPGHSLPIYSSFTVRANAARLSAAIKVDWDAPAS